MTAKSERGKMTRRAQTYVDSVYLDDLHEHPANPNEGDVEAVRESIRHNDWYGCVYAQAETGVILAGHTRVKAAREEGAVSVPVIYIDVTDEELDDVRILLADNRTAEMAKRNPRKLAQVFDDLLTETQRGITGTVYDQAAVDLVLGFDGGPPLPDLPDVDLPPIEEGHATYRCPACSHEWRGSPMPEDD